MITPRRTLRTLTLTAALIAGAAACTPPAIVEPVCIVSPTTNPATSAPTGTCAGVNP